ncbi:MAG TPA: PKD domain-containing protein, partial [Flavobacteriales bacterium]|nr:PKD domain-containing protein [Flavobacteriales bacterium]
MKIITLLKIRTVSRIALLSFALLMFGNSANSQCYVALNATDATCGTCADGSAEAWPDSTFTGPFTYQWDDSLAQTTSMATALLPGTYCVTMTDTNGCMATGCIQVGSNTPSGCNAIFYLYIDSSNTNMVYLIDNSTGNNLAYFWDFDDGNTSTQQSPTHVYTSFGTYNICLTVSDTVNSCQDTYCQNVVIVDTTSGSPCNASFNPYIDSSNTNMVYLIDNSTGNNLAYFW